MGRDLSVKRPGLEGGDAWRGVGEGCQQQASRPCSLPVLHGHPFRWIYSLDACSGCEQAVELSQGQVGI